MQLGEGYTGYVLLKRRVERWHGDSVQVMAPSVAAGRVAVGSCLLAFFC